MLVVICLRKGLRAARSDFCPAAAGAYPRSLPHTRGRSRGGFWQRLSKRRIRNLLYNLHTTFLLVHGIHTAAKGDCHGDRPRNCRSPCEAATALIRADSRGDQVVRRHDRDSDFPWTQEHGPARQEAVATEVLPGLVPWHPGRPSSTTAGAFSLLASCSQVRAHSHGYPD